MGDRINIVFFSEYNNVTRLEGICTWKTSVYFQLMLDNNVVYKFFYANPNIVALKRLYSVIKK